MRITEKDLQATVDRINRTAGTPEMPYSKRTDKMEPNAKCYHLSFAYGGVALHQMCDEGTGVHDILNGHKTKRELYNEMHAFLKGMGK